MTSVSKAFRWMIYSGSARLPANVIQKVGQSSTRSLKTVFKKNNLLLVGAIYLESSQQDLPNMVLVNKHVLCIKKTVNMVVKTTII